MGDSVGEESRLVGDDPDVRRVILDEIGLEDHFG